MTTSAGIIAVRTLSRAGSQAASRSVGRGVAPEVRKFSSGNPRSRCNFCRAAYHRQLGPLPGTPLPAMSGNRFFIGSFLSMGSILQ